MLPNKLHNSNLLSLLLSLLLSILAKFIYLDFIFISFTFLFFTFIFAIFCGVVIVIIVQIFIYILFLLSLYFTIIIICTIHQFNIISALLVSFNSTKFGQLNKGYLIIYTMIEEQKYNDEKVDNKPASQLSETSSKQNQQANIYYTKNKKIIFWLYLLVGVLFVVSQATLVSLNWQNFENFTITDSYYLANQVSYEWQRGFIVDIAVSPTSGCPAGYQPAFNFTWPGTSFGCYCQVDVNSSFVLQGYCSPKLIQSSCRNIQSQDSITATIWKNSTPICVKRSQVSFENEQKYDGNNKICGSSKSLTIMPLTENCPLVNATFSIPTLEDHYYRFSDTGSKLSAFYGTFNATSPYSFYSYPISKFTVSQYQFCLIDEDGGLTPDHVEFVLLNNKRGCASVGYYQTLDSITQIQFYANNPKLNSLNSINGFPKPAQWAYKLGFANIPSWTYNCRHNYDSKFSIPKALEIFNFQFFKSYYYIALVEILIFSALAFQIFILLIRRIFKRQVYPVGYRQLYLPKDFCIALTRYIIDFTCKFVILGLLIYTSWVIFVNWNWFKSALNINCSDSHQILITQVMEPFRDMYQKGVFYIVSQLVVFTFVVIIDIIHFIYIYRKDLCHYLVNSYGKVLVQHQVKDQLDWIGKEDDKKQFKLQNLKYDEGGNADDDKFRATMAMNIFDYQKSIEEPSKPKIVKKKKKKFGAFKKDYQNLQVNQNEDEFNPYTIQDPSIIGLNSIDNLSGNRKEKDGAEDGAEQSYNFAKKGTRRRKK